MFGWKQPKEEEKAKIIANLVHGLVAHVIETCPHGDGKDLACRACIEHELKLFMGPGLRIKKTGD